MNAIIHSLRSTGFTVPRRLKGLYKSTINHPEFPFAIHPSSKDQINLHVKWNEFFQKQCEYTERPTFCLHDGPPYANGSLHVGHALNKFLKDITIRYHILQGYRVDFVPGWDCHGLPIELKAACKILDPSPIQIRAKACAVASHYVDSQMVSFTSWGILGQWKKFYATMHPSYEAAELKAFSALHSKDLIYRHLLPVYWSGHSRTALAEYELEYNTEHVSRSLYLKIQLKNAKEKLPNMIKDGKQVFAVIWTTTPWTIPANEAVAYDPNSSYVFLKASPSGELYVVGKNFVERFYSMLQGQKLTIVDEFPGSQLEGLLYAHPLRVDSQSVMPFVPASHVVETVGTGLVHCAPCHGKEDFEVGRTFDLPMNSLVDESACYKSNTDPRLAGLSVLDSGNQKVLEILEPMTLLVESIQHSYPYDWRTKTPIITRLSEQWFLDTEKLSESALKAYQDVQVLPSNHKSSMLPFITSRPRWCISRQRVWGVPIPVLFRKADGFPIIDYEFIQYIADRAAQSGTDFWFKESVSELVPMRFFGKWSLTADDIKKSMDVFDVWFDSGLSWLCATHECSSSAVKDYVADLYLEGPDQFRGWFSASLLLSVALQNKAPYRKLVVHGFTADSKGRKMSKFIGNVCSPNQLIQDQKGCIDVLRHWAAFSGLDAVCSVGSKEMAQHAASYKMLRNSFRFLLGNLSDFDPLEQYRCWSGKNSIRPTSINQLFYNLAQMISHQADKTEYTNALDLAVLHWLGRIVCMALDHSYPNYRFDNLLSEVDQCISRLSSVYFTSMKDVLYCDAVDSVTRRTTQTIFWLTVECLKLLLCPILPYLTEEVEEICARYWSINSSDPNPPVSLLERLSATTLQSSSKEPANSDWLICMNTMREWTKHQACANAIELVHNLHHKLISALDSEGTVGSSFTKRAVSMVSTSHVSIMIPPTCSNLRNALQLLHPDRETVNHRSALCQLFRSASIHWLVTECYGSVEKSGNAVIIPLSFQDIQLAIRLKPMSSNTQCPRCLRHTRTAEQTVCSRCTHVLNQQTLVTN